METTEITLRVPRSWAIKLASLVEVGEYPSLNSMLLEVLHLEFDMPSEPYMGDRIDSWWEMI